MCFIAFIVCRVAFSVYETVYIVLKEADLSFIISNLCLTALTAFLSYAIYNGASTLTFLAALGGAYSLVTNFASETVIRYITDAERRRFQCLYGGPCGGFADSDCHVYLHRRFKKMETIFRGLPQGEREAGGKIVGKAHSEK